MSQIYLHYSSKTDKQIKQYSDDRYDYSWDSSTDFEPLGLYTDNGPWQETVDLEDVDNPKDFIDKFFTLIVARYSTGDTFGHGTGHWTIVDCFPEDAARERETLKYLNMDKKNKALPKKYKDMYRPWDGYFERLEGFEVHHLRLVNGVCPTSLYY